MQIVNQNQEIRRNVLRFLIRLLHSAALLTLFGSAVLSAQSVTARFSGQVTDSDGGAIPGASMQVINEERLARREAKTDPLGAYVVPSLPAGRYQIIVEAEGFSRRSSDIITVVAGQNFVFNVQLTVGGVQTKVEVDAGAG